MSGSHALSTIEPLIPSSTTNLLTPTSSERSHSPDTDRNLCVMLDDRGNVFQFSNDIPFFVFLLFVQIMTLNLLFFCSSIFFIFKNKWKKNQHVDLWMRFQNLTNEMIVTKNGR